MTAATDRAKPTREIRAALEQARVLLLEPTPRNIDLCCTSLTQAAGWLEALPDRQAFRPEIDAIASLLESAAAFHAGLFQKMHVASDSAGDCAERAVAAPRIRLSA